MSLKSASLNGQKIKRSRSNLFKSANQQGTDCFYWINIARKTCLIPARISSRFLVSQPGVGEMEYWNIYQSVAYSAEGPLCVPVWSFTTCSQIKYLSHLNKKASAGSCRVVVYVCVCVCVSECTSGDVSRVLSGMIGVESRAAGVCWACQDGDMRLTSLSTHSQRLESASAYPLCCGYWGGWTRQKETLCLTWCCSMPLLRQEIYGNKCLPHVRIHAQFTSLLLTGNFWLLDL